MEGHALETGEELLVPSLPGNLVGPSCKEGARFGSHGLETTDPSPLAVNELSTILGSDSRINRESQFCHLEAALSEPYLLFLPHPPYLLCPQTRGGTVELHRKWLD